MNEIIVKEKAVIVEEREREREEKSTYTHTEERREEIIKKRMN